MTETTTTAVPPMQLLPNAASRTDLEDWGPYQRATGAAMRTSGITQWNGPSGQETGIWECTPGAAVLAYETNEFIAILSGAMTVTPDGGDPVEMRAGDAALFPLGWRGTWDIHETVRKLYVIF